MATQSQEQTESDLESLIIPREKVEHPPKSNHVKALIRYLPEEKNPRLGVCKEGLEFLQTIDKKIVLVTIFGEKRSGKSTMVNRLLRLSGRLEEDETGFEVSDSVIPETVGIDIYTIPIENGDYSLFFLDSEGLGADGVAYDILIPNIATIISSHIVIHDKGHYSVPNLNFLNSSLKLIEGIAGKNATFPSITWVIQQFNSKSDLSETQFIQKVLLNKNAKDGDLKCTVKSIRRIFKGQQIRAFRIPCPVKDIDKFSLLDKMKFEEFIPKYQEEMKTLHQRVIETHPQSCFKNQEPATGTVLAAKLLGLVNSVNNGNAAIYMHMLQHFADEIRIKVEESCANEFNQIHFPCENEELDQILSRHLRTFEQDVESCKDNDHVQRIRTILVSQLGQLLNNARNNNNEESRRSLNRTSEETLNACNLAIGIIQQPCDPEVFQNIKTEMMHEYDEKVGVARRHPEAQQFRNRFESQLTQLLNIARNKNDEESRRVLNATSEETLNACNLAIGIIQQPCADGIVRNVKTEMMNRYNQNVGFAGRHPEAQQISNNFEIQIDQRINEAILRNTLTTAKRDATTNCIDDIRRIIYPCRDVETTLNQIQKDTMDKFAQRLIGVADDNPQKMDFRARLTNIVDLHFHKVKFRNVVNSLELIERAYCAFTNELQNKGFFTKTTTIASGFQKRLKGLVVCKTCNQYVTELVMAARCIEEHETVSTIKTVAALAVGVVVTAASVVAVPVLLSAAAAVAPIAEGVVAAASAVGSAAASTGGAAVGVAAAAAPVAVGVAAEGAAVAAPVAAAFAGGAAGGAAIGVGLVEKEGSDYKMGLLSPIGSRIHAALLNARNSLTNVQREIEAHSEMETQQEAQRVREVQQEAQRVMETQQEAQRVREDQREAQREMEVDEEDQLPNSNNRKRRNSSEAAESERPCKVRATEE